MLQYALFNYTEHKNTRKYWIIFGTTALLYKHVYLMHEFMMNAPLVPFCRLSVADISHILGNLEEISTFQQMLVQSLEEHTKSVHQSAQTVMNLDECSTENHSKMYFLL